MELKYYCKNFNCNNIICYKTYKNGSGLCRSCAGKLVKRNRMKENNSNFKGGKPKCKICGKTLSSYTVNLCRQCYLLKREINISKIQLIDFYIKQKLSMEKIAKIFSCTNGSIFNKLHKYKIKVRSKTETYGGKGNPNFKGMVRKCIDCKKIINPYTKNTKRCWDCSVKYNSGKNHYNWNNWSSRGEYGAEFDNALKEQVRFRDNYKCQICGCSQLENGRKLDVHHIDYNKKYNKLNNLIALCMKCHMKTNHNREYWTKYFQKSFRKQGINNECKKSKFQIKRTIKIQ